MDKKKKEHKSKKHKKLLKEIIQFSEKGVKLIQDISNSEITKRD